MQPYRCPVCSGRGVVAAGFYLLGPYPTASCSTTAPATEACRSCAGGGIVWTPGSQGGGVEPLGSVDVSPNPVTSASWPTAIFKWVNLELPADCTETYTYPRQAKDAPNKS